MALKISLIVFCITLFCRIDAAMLWGTRTEPVATAGSMESYGNDTYLYQPKPRYDEITIHGTTNAKKQKGPNVLVRLTKWLLVRLLPFALLFAGLALYSEYRKGQKEEEDKPKPKKGLLMTDAEVKKFGDARNDVVMNMVLLNQKYNLGHQNPGAVHKVLNEETQKMKDTVGERAQAALEKLFKDPTLTQEERAELEPLTEILEKKIKPLVAYASPALLDYVRSTYQACMDIVEPKYGMDFSDYRQYLLQYDGTKQIQPTTQDYGAVFMKYLNDHKDTIADDEWQRGEFFALEFAYSLPKIADFNNIIATPRGKIENFLNGIEGSKDDVLGFYRANRATYG